MFDKNELKLIMCALNDASKYNMDLADDESTNREDEVECLRTSADYLILSEKVRRVWDELI